MPRRTPLPACTALLAGGVGALIVFTAAPRSAHADDAALSACIAENESSIQRRSEHKLLDARAQALMCATDASCPALLRDACNHRVEQVDAALPSIAFDVKDTTGADVAARVSIDGHPVTDTQGKAIPVDPGEHKFVFEVSGLPPIEKSFTLREGEKDRREPIVVGKAPAPGSATPTPNPTLPAAPPDADAGASGWSTQKTLALVAGGVGVAGIAVGSVFGWMAHSSWSSSQSECPSAANCPQHTQAVSDHDSATTSATLATIAFAAGGAALAAGGVLWFTAPRSESGRSATTSSVRLAPGVGPGSASLVVTGVFW